MEHETTPNRQISRSRFVSPFCVCFDDKNVFDPPSAGTPKSNAAPRRTERVKSDVLKLQTRATPKSRPMREVKMKERVYT